MVEATTDTNSTSNATTPSTETYLTAIEPALPATINTTVIGLTDNLVTQFRNHYPESNRSTTALTFGCLSIVLRQTNDYVPDHALRNAVWTTVTDDNDRIRTDAPFRPVTENQIYRTRRQVSNELSIPLEPTRPADRAPAAYDNIAIPDELVDNALNYIDRIPETVYSGCKPSCVLAGAIYAIATATPGTEITQQTLADTFNVSKAGIRAQVSSLTKSNVEQLP